MSIFLLINEKTGEILADRLPGSHSAERKARDLLEREKPGEAPTYLVCHVVSRVEAEVEVRVRTEIYPDLIFGETPPPPPPAPIDDVPLAPPAPAHAEEPI